MPKRQLPRDIFLDRNYVELANPLKFALDADVVLYVSKNLYNRRYKLMAVEMTVAKN